MSDSHLPCHALPMLFFSRPWHSTAVERRPVGYLPTFGFFWLPRGVRQRLLSEAYQSSSQRSIPATVKSGSSTLQKRWSVKLLDQQFGYFRLPRGLSRRTRHYQSMAGSRHGMYELTQGMAGECHAMCESALRGTYVQLHSILEWDGGEWPTWCSGHFTPQKRSYPLNRRLGGSQNPSGWFWKRRKERKDKNYYPTRVQTMGQPPHS